jgi:hypothetical protein
MAHSLPLLAAECSLPPNPQITFTVHSPINTGSDYFSQIHLARRCIIAQNVSKSFLCSLFYSVRIDKNNPGIYVFAITSHDRLQDVILHLSALQFEGLKGQYFRTHT